MDFFVQNGYPSVHWDNYKWDIHFKEEPFSLVEGTTGQASNIQVIDGRLICSHNRGAFVIEGGKTTKILDNVGYWVFKKIPKNPKFHREYGDSLAVKRFN